MAKTIVSIPAAPAAHSPTMAPEAVLVLAAMIASRSVQTPSSAVVSAALVTVIVAAAAACARSNPAANARRDDCENTGISNGFIAHLLLKRIEGLSLEVPIDVEEEVRGAGG